MGWSPWVVRVDPPPTGHDGPLGHVTVCVKDNIDVAGVPTSGGTTFAYSPAAVDAPIVARLREAGAVIAGKGHTNEFAYGIDGVNEMIGAARNPHDPDRITGGSSSGPAVAVATGEADLGLGTDTSGSLRVPAALCGVTSLRPTHGALPMDGVMPLVPSFDVAGPIARTNEMLTAAWNVLAGQPASDEVAPVRSAAVLSSCVEGVHAEVAAALDATVALLETLGITVTQLDDDLVARAAVIQQRIQFPDASASILALASERWRELPAPIVERVEAGLAGDPADYERAQAERAALAAHVVELLEEYDALLAPAVPAPAPPIGAATIDLPGGPVPVRQALLSRAVPFSQAGVPVLTVPNGLVDGLPVGVQIAAAPGEELRLLELGARIEAAAA